MLAALPRRRGSSVRSRRRHLRREEHDHCGGLLPHPRRPTRGRWSACSLAGTWPPLPTFSIPFARARPWNVSSTRETWMVAVETVLTRMPSRVRFGEAFGHAEQADLRGVVERYEGVGLVGTRMRRCRSYSSRSLPRPHGVPDRCFRLAGR